MTPTGEPARTHPLALGLLGAMLLISIPPAVSPPTLAGSTRPLSAPANGSSARLAVDPASWWMIAGNVTSFSATWVDPAPGCALDPYWFRWSIPNAPAEGTIDPASDASVNFTAEAAISGRTTLLVRAAAELQCGANVSAVFANATADVTVAVPLQVQNLSIGPTPIAGGGTAFLSGTITGGESPYTLRVSWGDGSVSSANLSAPGPFAVPHAFPTGEFAPSVLANDSTGLFTRATVEEALTVSDTLAVGITPVRYVTDVDVPLEGFGTIANPPGTYDTGWSCGNAPDGATPSGTGAVDFSCTFSATGTGEVFFEALPPAPAPPATATLYESVVPAPTLSVATPNVTAEVGEPSLIGFDVTGGVPPFVLDWDETGSGVGGRLVVPVDGTLVLPVDPTEAGTLELAAHLTDADGLETLSTSTILQVDGALNGSVADGSAENATGAILGLAGTVTAGSPPFAWAVVPGFAPASETPPAGALVGAGSFAWSGLYRTEGSVEITVVVADSGGDLIAVDLDLLAVPTLRGSLLASGGDSPQPLTFDVTGSIEGGLPPFVVTVTASDGEMWNRTAYSDGAARWTLTATAAGPLAIRVRLVDGLGAALSWNGSVVVMPAPAVLLTSSSAGSYVAGTVGLAVGVVAGVLLLRHRRSSRIPPAPPDPVAVLERIVAPADGADRSTVELLAEEAGIPLEIVRSTIDRLVAAGTIRSEVDAEGEEVISWESVPRT